MRDRLTKLIINAPKLEFPIGSRVQGKTYQTAQNIADHLLANGVIVLPCKVGDKVYALEVDYEACDDCDCFSRPYEIGEICECDINYPCFPSVETYFNNECCPKHELEIVEHNFSIALFEWVKKGLGKTVFLTKEEAERKLAEVKNDTT